LRRYGLVQLLGDVDAKDLALLLFDPGLECVVDRSGINRIDPDVAPGESARGRAHDPDLRMLGRDIGCVRTAAATNACNA
jgi:hypothetical protein